MFFRSLGIKAPEGEGRSFSSTAFAAGDTVSVQLEADILRLLQEDHGGWNDTMVSVSIAGEIEIGVILHRFSYRIFFCQRTNLKKKS